MNRAKKSTFQRKHRVPERVMDWSMRKLKSVNVKVCVCGGRLRVYTRWWVCYREAGAGASPGGAADRPWGGAAQPLPACCPTYLFMTDHWGGGQRGRVVTALTTVTGLRERNKNKETERVTDNKKDKRERDYREQRETAEYVEKSGNKIHKSK